MDLGEESPTAVSLEAEEVHDQDSDHDDNPNANLADEDEAASEDEPGLEPFDMQHMIAHSQRTEHSGLWCIEVDRIFYLHIGITHFKVKDDFYVIGRRRKFASQIVKRTFVVPRPRRFDVEDIFEGLSQFEEERRKGKRNTTTAPTGNKKKPRPVEAIAEEPFDPM
ncbi:hypothetical protein R1sor_008981 [Riccia sorocarpa]|uniref:Uncharacterized protein n=1 Tax=Riccia sorocarpa TaxID=122646 RepID=A0ABD3H788_9MARC